MGKIIQDLTSNKMLTQIMSYFDHATQLASKKSENEIYAERDQMIDQYVDTNDPNLILTSRVFSIALFLSKGTNINKTKEEPYKRHSSHFQFCQTTAY